MGLRTIADLDISRKRVFIRVDFNVGLESGQITDDTRIRESLPTIQYALEKEAKVILASHLGRPNGRDEKLSLLPMAERLSELLGKDVIFTEDCIGNGVKKLTNELKGGQVMLLENVRFHPEEEKNDPVFSEKLASLADCYVNDAFGALHRAHASIDGMAHFFTEKGVGLLLKKEIDFLKKILENPPKPFFVVLGGGKISDKIGLIENLMKHVDTFLIGGAMAYTFLAALGKQIGQSRFEETKVHQATRILKNAETRGVKILLPTDSIVTDEIKRGGASYVIRHGEKWEKGFGVDIGPETQKFYSEEIKKAGAVFWNGPMGIFEIPPFDQGTKSVAKAISKTKALSVAGGGETLASIHEQGLDKNFSFLSTGGGAMMEFMEGKELPGLTALRTPKNTWTDPRKQQIFEESKLALAE